MACGLVDSNDGLVWCKGQGLNGGGDLDNKGLSLFITDGGCVEEGDLENPGAVCVCSLVQLTPPRDSAIVVQRGGADEAHL